MFAFWRNGFQATSIGDLCAAMGIKAPSLYAAFGSKEALYVEAVEHYAATIGPSVWGRLAEGSTGRSGINNLLLAAAQMMPEGDATPGGCMVALAGAGEVASGPVPAAIKKLRLNCLRLLREHFKKAIARRELPSSTNIDRWSRFYFGVYLGMAIQARDGATSAELKGIAKAAMAAWPATR